MYSLLVLPYASAVCGTQDPRLIRTAFWQQAVIGGPLLGAMFGTAIVGCGLAPRPPYRGLVIALGYLVALVTLVTSWAVATAAP